MTRHAEHRSRERHIPIPAVEEALRHPTMTFSTRRSIVIRGENGVSVVIGTGQRIVTVYRADAGRTAGAVT